MEYNDLMNTNGWYDKYHRRWKYLLHSYMGGDSYRKGEYLTRYQMETETEYQERLAVTPLDNHCKGCISIYNSFLFRKPAYREFGSLTRDPILEPFLKDCDLEGRSLDAFMKDVSTYTSILGSAWVMVTKPNSNARTRAEELLQQIRPYLSLITPLNVLDWKYERAASGFYYLSYLKYIEDKDGDMMVVKEWYEDTILTHFVDENKKEVRETQIDDNQLGLIPAVCVYNQRSPKRGIGVSNIEDIADLQRAIYNEYAEVEALVRLSNHPSLVKVASTEAGAGAGAIILMDENMDSGLKPYLLQPDGENLDSLYNSIEKKVDAIDRIAHLGAMRENKTSTMSGVSRQMEFEQLNSLLSEKADMMELGEEQIWRLVAAYQSKAWDGVIDYPDSFNIQDKQSDMQLLEIASRTNPADATTRAIIDYKVRELLNDEEEFIFDDKESVQERLKKLNTHLMPDGTMMSNDEMDPEDSDASI